ncbi:MAG TPA: N-acetylmuramic acid 6-phosphate etherase [Candidatus Bathyarchaeia archaeon]
MSKTTEGLNPASKGIDARPLGEVLRLINGEDRRVAEAVTVQLPAIESAAERMVEALRGGGRVFLVGAGTSGRLCMLEAAEVPPTFGVPNSLIQGVIAGGVPALYGSVEAAEDDADAARGELEARGLGPLDLVVGVAASGSTPFTLAAVRYAAEVGASTVGLSCNRGSPLSGLVDVPIEVVVGPEVVAGSTRMKAGTAQKMVLNMLTTASMIRLGRVHDGYMVGVQASNAKLVDRARRTLSAVTGIPPEEAARALESAGGDLRAAILMTLAGVGADEASEALSGWASVRDALRRTKS